MIIKQVNFNDFLNRFEQLDRDSAFTYEAKRFIFDYLENLSEEMDENIELDVIAICSYWREYEKDDFVKEYAEHDDQSLDEIVEEHSNSALYVLENGNLLVNEIY